MKFIILAAMVLVYAYQMALAVLQLKSKDRPVPANVADVYDADTYRTWKAYRAEKGRLNLCRHTAGFVIEIILMAACAYAAFAGLFPGTVFAQMFAVILLSALSGLLLIPFEYYDTMHIEEKYGFNRSTKRTFWMDQVKNFLIGLLLMMFFCGVLIWLHDWLGDNLIIAYAIVMTAFMLLFSFLYPVFSRIFNKFTPLEDGELKEKLQSLLDKNGYKARAIQVMDASRRSTKSNAYFSGFGKMKTIVLYDTLVESMEPDEICAVFAHELGHGMHKDTLKYQILSFLQMLIVGVLAFLTLRTPELFRAFGFGGLNYGFAILLIMSVEFALISPLFELIANAHSRRAEYRADAFSAQEGYGPALISALKKLSRQNYSDLSPHPLLVKLEYSHPTLSQRIEAIEKAENR